MDLKDSTVLITGGGRGIGRFTAHAFARAGASVAVCSRTEAEVMAVAREVEGLGGRAHAVVGDIAREEDVTRIVSSTEEALGGIDVLVNNAAAFARGAVVDLPVEDWDRVMATNLRGTFLVTKAALPGMIRRGGGSVILVSSTSGKRGNAGLSAYSASKHALAGLAHSLLYEVREHDVRVVLVSPSAVDTRDLAEGVAKEGGPGARLRAEDVADGIVHAATLPPRALVREYEIWATNP